MANLKHSTANSNPSNQIRSIRIQIRIIEQCERDSRHLNGICDHSKGIQSIRTQILTTENGFDAFKWNFEQFERDLSIRIQIRTIRKGFETFESKLEPFKRDSKHWNANSNHSNRIRSI